MKKIILLVVAFLFAITLTSCIPNPTDDIDPVCINGQILIDGECHDRNVVTDLDIRFGELKTRFDDTQDELDQAQVDLDETILEYELTEAQINTLQGTINSVQALLDNTDENLIKDEDSLDQAEANLNSVDLLINSFYTNLSDFVPDLDIRLGILQTRFDDTQDELDQAQIDLDETILEYELTEAQINTLQGTIDSIQALLDNTNENLIADEDSLDQAEANLDSVDLLLVSFYTNLSDFAQVLIIDEELLAEIQEVRDSLASGSVEGELNLIPSTNVGGPGLYGQMMSAPRPSFNDTSAVSPFINDEEWLAIQIRYYNMLEEIVLNGYRQGNYENPLDFLDAASEYLEYYNENQEFGLIIDLEQQTLFSRTITYEDETFSNILEVESIYAELDENNQVFLERYLQRYVKTQKGFYGFDEYISVEIFNQSKGLAVVELIGDNVLVYYYSGTNIGDFTTSVFRGSYINGLPKRGVFNINYYNWDEELYLVGAIEMQQGYAYGVVYNQLSSTIDMTDMYLLDQRVVYADKILASLNNNWLQLSDLSIVNSDNALQLETQTIRELFASINELRDIKIARYEELLLESELSLEEQNELDSLIAEFNNLSIGTNTYDIYDDVLEEINLENFPYATTYEEDLVIPGFGNESLDRYDELSNNTDISSYLEMESLILEFVQYNIIEGNLISAVNGNIVQFDEESYSGDMSLILGYTYFDDFGTSMPVTNEDKYIRESLEYNFNILLNDLSVFNVDGNNYVELTANEIMLLIQDKLYIETTE